MNAFRTSLLAAAVAAAASSLAIAAQDAPKAAEQDATEAPAKTKPMADILAASPKSDWRPLDPENTL